MTGKTMTNAEIADVFDQVADLLEFQGANPFRTRAYRNGARALRDLPEPVAAILQDPQRPLTDLPGIGKDLAGKCATLVETGRLPILDELLEQIPQSVLALLRIPGLGPKKAAVLFHDLGITTLEGLATACREGRVRQLKGFGAKTEQAILQGMSVAASADQRLLWAEADVIVQSVLGHLRTCPRIRNMEMAGSYRRGKETVGDLDVLVVADNAEEVMDHFAQFAGTRQVLLRGGTKMSIRTARGLQIDLRVVPQKSFGAALQYFTGSKQHNVELRGLARQRGLKINEYGVFRASDPGDQYVAGATEQDVYAALELPLFPPELREARREYAWARDGQLPELVSCSDIRGDLHMHTHDSDGKVSMEEMAEAAVQRGLKYIAITDHSQRVTMANGLDPKRLLQQWKHVDQLNQQYGKRLTVLKGVECDILEKGGLDLPDDVLAQADWVLASIHYGQRQSRQQITERILEALENPHVSAIAHPTGRLLNRRDPYSVDIDAVLRAAKENRKLLELNAHPMRLDLNDIHCAAAQSLGIPIVIATDAHEPNGLDDMRYGILQARRAGLTKKDVANTRSWPQLKKLFMSRDSQ
jgi:DNA polymerase (family 10)